MRSSPPRVLITAGPTHEPIDAVRYVANRSSGRMGVALAEASARRGWPTTLLLGPTSLGPPQSSQIHTVRFQSTADLQQLLREHWPSHDVLLMAAAIADYTPIRTGEAKIKRNSSQLTLELAPTPDLLAELAILKRPEQFAVGFALEPADRLFASARDKLQRKRIDAIVANPLETMDSLTITATVFFSDGRIVEAGPNRLKEDFADWLLEVLLAAIQQRA